MSFSAALHHQTTSSRSSLVPRPVPLRRRDGCSRLRAAATSPSVLRRAAVVAAAASPSSASSAQPKFPTTTVSSSPPISSSPLLSIADLSRPVLSSHGFYDSSAATSTSAVFQVADLPPPKAPPRGAAAANASSSGLGGVAAADASGLASVALAVAAGLACAYGFARLKKNLDTPGRPWLDDTTVGREYDAWTEEKILEYYWGEHIHLGYYSDADLAKGAGTLLGCKVKDFIEAKLDFVDEMRRWSGCPESPAKVLDVGCGIGGASRRLAATFGSGTQVTGITLSPKQAQRATALALDQGIPNADFRVMDALAMDFPDNSFDFVWACESGEHMPVGAHSLPGVSGWSHGPYRLSSIECLLPYALLGLSLPGGVRLVTWTILGVIN
jgi:MPBQ/MSBQ methyltransferase